MCRHGRLGRRGNPPAAISSFLRAELLMFIAAARSGYGPPPAANDRLVRTLPVRPYHYKGSSPHTTRLLARWRRGSLRRHAEPTAGSLSPARQSRQAASGKNSYLLRSARSKPMY
jgi:hypothetical protein